MSAHNPKADAWRVAGNLVTEYATDLLSRCTSSPIDDKARGLAEHLRDNVAPSLYRRAEIIERRKTLSQAPVREPKRRHAWKQMARGYKCERCGMRRVWRDRPQKRGSGTTIETWHVYADGREVAGRMTPPCEPGPVEPKRRGRG